MKTSCWPLILAVAGGIASAQPAAQPAQPAAQPAAPAPAPAQPAPAPGPTPVKEAPPSGPGLGVAPKPITLKPEELEALKDVEAEYDRFIQAANDHDKRMRQIAHREYDNRTSELEKRYAERIAKTETDRTKRHTDTIALVEKFLQNHPNHQQFTPDAMFRLADLYLDQADEDVEQKLAAQEAATAAGNPPSADQAAIVADYSKSLALWEDILKRFPSYRQTPSTLYLLGYYGKTKDDRRSLQVFLALACANHYKWDATPPPPPTKEEAIKRVESKQLRDPYADCKPYEGAENELVRHAWVRGIADYHFTVVGELDESIAAYLKVANGGNDSPLYAESLYKLAWSYYKRDFLKDSIDRFDQSVKLYDSIVAKGDQPPLELREESIQYIAVAFTDPWEGETDTDAVKAFARAKAYYQGRENEPHVRDVWVALGKAFEDLQAWDQAVDAFRIALGPPWELDPHNPIVHQEIVNAFESKGDKYAADQAAAELAIKYGPGTAWYQANESNREAMESQRRIAERALYAAARNTHSAAAQMRQDFDASSKKDPQAKQDYLAMYAKAVDLYRQFITTYPESDYIYEFSYQEAEALYWSEHYPEAIAQYTWVRDHRDLGTNHYVEAAQGVLNSYLAEMDVEVAAGRLKPLKIPTVAELKAVPQPWQPEPIPDFYQKLQREYVTYQEIVKDPATAPGQGINAALISEAYFHMDDAIARLKDVMTKFCGAPPAKKGELAPAARAKDGILAIYEAQDNFDAIEATNKAFINQKCGDDNSIALAISQNRSLNFQRAGELYKKNQYLPAAEAFYKFYKTAQKDDPDLPVALYNAAVSYKLADKPKTAIGLFKEFTANPDKKFRQSPYYLDALRLTGASYQAAFDYDNAIKTYLDLYDTTKQAKKLGIKPPDPIPGEKPLTLDQIGLDAVYNAAFAAELNRDYKKAIDLYGQYGRIESDRRKQDRALWSIANLYRQQGDVNSMTETLDRWRGKYGKDTGNADDYVKSYYDTAKLLHAKGRTPQAKATQQATIDAWKKMGAEKNSKGSKMAAEFAVDDAEDFYAKQWEPLQITRQITSTNPKTVKAELQKMKDSIETVRKKTEDKYIELDQYGVLEASMCAKVRFGDIQYDRAQKIANIPIPKLLNNYPEVVEAFEAARDEALKKDLDEARGDWEDVYNKAKQGGVANKWSQHASENLSREFPDQYHTLRQELVQGTDKP
jgi:tetratricopeptide (TPR) repeat protein